MSKINYEIREREMDIKVLREQVEVDKKLMNDIVAGKRTIYDVYPDYTNRGGLYYTSVDWLKTKINIAIRAIDHHKKQISELYQEREWYAVECNPLTEYDIERIIGNGNYIIGIRL